MIVLKHLNILLEDKGFDDLIADIRVHFYELDVQVCEDLTADDEERFHFLEAEAEFGLDWVDVLGEGAGVDGGDLALEAGEWLVGG